jgi:branched-subunit amino acid aminotransferase/4-amino-4-deoxychorismate lyase
VGFFVRFLFTPFPGLSSNVVFVDNAVGCVVTAPSDLVLTGTILQLLLTICEEDKIPVKRECPKLSDFAKGGVLITSTSRLALPVRQIFMPDGESVQLQTRSHIMDQLVEKVRQRIENASVQIL